ncbi:MAG: flagellar basal-body rod protein FlgG [Planctomycetes bacterium]|nr:flagellar basal-body rod protein FlgG [Planctomycetota bacterium]
MAIVALHSASTGLSALSTNIDVIANNLANVNTAGFKASRANFEDLLYQMKQQPGVETASGDQRPAGLQVGMGTRISNTQYDFTKGSPQITGRPLDLMIDGNGLFRVSIPPDRGNGVGYSRAGNFFLNSDGEVVLGNTTGSKLDPPITVPQDATNLTVSADGIVSAQLPGQTTYSQLGQLQLATFVNPNGLQSIGGNLYIESAASGPPIEGTPAQGSFGSIIQNALESSNVDPVHELVDLIKAQRAFEMNSQSIQVADQTLQVISNLRR